MKIDMERFRRDAAELIRKINEGDFHLSASSLRNFSDSPAHFIYSKCIRLQKEDDDKDITTPAMIEGSLVHCMALEPDKLWKTFVLNNCTVRPGSANQSKFAEEIVKNELRNAAILAKIEAIENGYVLKPDEEIGEPIELDLGKLYGECYKVGPKDDAAKLGEDLAGTLKPFVDYKISAAGRTEITGDNLQAATLLHDALMNSRAGKYFDPTDTLGESEVGMKWEYAGIRWRGYIDRRYNENAGVILDLKKTTDAHPKKFGWTVRDMHYDEQIELYRIASQMPDARGLLIALEPPFHISINEVHPSALRAARRKIDFYISEFKRCILEDAWWQSYGFYSTPAEDHDALLPTSFVFR